jgi:hypothetical protein
MNSLFLKVAINFLKVFRIISLLTPIISVFWYLNSAPAILEYLDRNYKLGFWLNLPLLVLLGLFNISLFALYAWLPNIINKKRFALNKIGIQNDQRPAILYLRTFFTGKEEVLSFVPVNTAKVLLEHGAVADVGQPQNPWIQELQKSIQKFGALIVLDGPDKNDLPRSLNDFQFEANFYFIVTKGSKWQDKFKLYAKHAYIILLLPDLSTSLIEYELPFLRESELYKRTIVFMPPTPTDSPFIITTGSVYKKSMSVSGGWAYLKHELADKGFNLPPYTYNGMFYIPNADFSVSVKYDDIEFKNPNRSLTKAFKMLLENMPGSKKNFLTVAQIAAMDSTA